MTLFAAFGWQGLPCQLAYWWFCGDKGGVSRAEGFSDEVFSEADMHVEKEVEKGGGDGDAWQNQKMRVGHLFHLEVKGMALRGKSIRLVARKVTFRMPKGNLLLYKKKYL